MAKKKEPEHLIVSISKIAEKIIKQTKETKNIREKIIKKHKDNDLKDS